MRRVPIHWCSIGLFHGCVGSTGMPSASAPGSRTFKPCPRIASLWVFLSWHASHIDCRLPSSSLPPSARPTMWSTCVAKVTRPARRHGLHSPSSLARMRARLRRHGRPPRPDPSRFQATIYSFLHSAGESSRFAVVIHHTRQRKRAAQRSKATVARVRFSWMSPTVLVGFSTGASHCTRS